MLKDSFSFQAWHVIVGNALRLGSINSIGDFILFLAKCLVTLIIGSLALFTLRSNPELHFHAIPIIIICIFTFFVAHCVISLHEVTLCNNLVFSGVIFCVFTINIKALICNNIKIQFHSELCLNIFMIILLF